MWEGSRKATRVWCMRYFMLYLNINQRMRSLLDACACAAQARAAQRHQQRSGDSRGGTYHDIMEACSWR